MKEVPPSSPEAITFMARNMAADRQIIARSGVKAVTCRLPDYLEDAPFKGMWDQNPMFEEEPEPEPARSKKPQEPSLF